MMMGCVPYKDENGAMMIGSARAFTFAPLTGIGANAHVAPPFSARSKT